MELYRALQNTKLTGMDHEVSEYLWDEFHRGNLNDEDDFNNLLHEWIEDQVIYTYDCQAILENNMEYCFDEHEIWGRPENIAQAAYSCLYDYIHSSTDLVRFDEMQEVLQD